MKTILFCLVLSFSLNAQTNFSSDCISESSTTTEPQASADVNPQSLFGNHRVDLNSGTLVLLETAEQFPASSGCPRSFS